METVVRELLPLRIEEMMYEESKRFGFNGSFEDYLKIKLRPVEVIYDETIQVGRDVKAEKKYV